MIDRANYVIVGGGVLGCSLAYHLAEAGQTGILVLDQGEIAEGTTSQGAGLIGQVRGSVEQTQLIMKTRQAIQELCDRDLNPDWHAVGSLRVSLNQARDEEFDHLYLTALKADLPVSFLSRTEAAKLFPGLNLEGARRILWCPSDGYVSAPQMAKSYATAAERLGVVFATHTQLLGFLMDDQAGIQGIRTTGGEIRTPTVILAAGAMAARVGAMAGLRLPIFPVRHQSLVSADLADFSPNLPVVRIPDARFYIRPFGNAALLGAFTEKCLAHDMDDVTTGYPQAREDRDELNLLFTEATRFLPALASSRIAQVRKGLPSCTPDGTALLGPVPGISGLHLLAGCQAFGVAGSGGLASLLVEAILQGQLPAQAKSFNPARWLRNNWEENTARSAAEKITQNYYALKK